MSATDRSKRTWQVETVAGWLAYRGSAPMHQTEGWSVSLRRHYRKGDFLIGVLRLACAGLPPPSVAKALAAVGSGL